MGCNTCLTYKRVYFNSAMLFQPNQVFLVPKPYQAATGNNTISELAGRSNGAHSTEGENVCTVKIFNTMCTMHPVCSV